MSEEKTEKVEKPKPEVKPIEVLTFEEKDGFRKKLFSIVRHIRNVEDAGLLLAERIITAPHATTEDHEFARRLIQRLRRHDNSKFEGIEWEFLHREEEDAELLKIAILQHQQANDHHPEYFVGGISQMNDLQLAEMVCDWKARSTEMGTGLRQYIIERATVRFGFSTKTKIYKTIKKFVDLLLDDEFSKS